MVDLLSLLRRKRNNEKRNSTKWKNVLFNHWAFRIYSFWNTASSFKLIIFYSEMEIFLKTTIILWGRFLMFSFIRSLSIIEMVVFLFHDRGSFRENVLSFMGHLKLWIIDFFSFSLVCAIYCHFWSICQ